MNSKFKILLIPDTIFWITGTISQSILKHVSSVEGDVCSGSVVYKIMQREPEWFDQFDLIHVICPYSSRFIIPFFLGKKPIVTTIHHVIEWQRMEHNVQGDMIMTLSKEWENYLLNKGVSKNKLMLIHNGVNTDKFSPVSQSKKIETKKKIGFPPESFVIGFFAKRQASDFDRKGIDTFESAIRLIAAKESSIAVLLVGPGWSKLIRSFDRYGVPFKWFPYLDPHEKIIDLYSTLDCYWITSKVEGGPVTLLEAMSCGVPCVSTPVGLSLELIEEGVTGFLFQKGDYHELVDKTRLLIGDRTLLERTGTNARNKVASKMDYSTVLMPITDLYSKAIENFLDKESIGAKRVSVKPAIPKKYWMIREEYTQWLSILRRLGEYNRAFLFGLVALMKYPSLAIAKLQIKILYDLCLNVLR
ncbi:MAG: glycosyltransferase family 4 protein [Cyclobacteriaceae bacterium]|nr:glycosyltransferase family 4 protein [Cyclobacteriaceae bacterium]